MSFHTVRRESRFGRYGGGYSEFRNRNWHDNFIRGFQLLDEPHQRSVLFRKNGGPGAARQRGWARDYAQLFDPHRACDSHGHVAGVDGRIFGPRLAWRYRFSAGAGGVLADLRKGQCAGARVGAGAAVGDAEDGAGRAAGTADLLGAGPDGNPVAACAVCGGARTCDPAGFARNGAECGLVGVEQQPGSAGRLVPVWHGVRNAGGFGCVAAAVTHVGTFADEDGAIHRALFVRLGMDCDGDAGSDAGEQLFGNKAVQGIWERRDVRRVRCCGGDDVVEPVEVQDAGAAACGAGRGRSVALGIILC